MKLSELHKALQEELVTASINPEHYPEQTRPGFATLVTQAKEQVARLQQQYAAALKAEIQPYFCSSKPIASPGNPAVDSDELYRQVAERIEETMGASRTITASQAVAGIAALNTIARELGVLSYKDVKFNGDGVYKTKDDIVNFVRSSVREALGDELVSLYLMKAAVTMAQAEKTTPKSLFLKLRPEEQPFFTTLFAKPPLDGDALETVPSAIEEVINVEQPKLEKQEKTSKSKKNNNQGQ